MVIIGIPFAKAYPASIPRPTPFSVKSITTKSHLSIHLQMLH
ncbi:hypothetical protein [Tissierella praeacuta]|nr:hypothetical protein [Tissierella praeacuta]